MMFPLTTSHFTDGKTFLLPGIQTQTCLCQKGHKPHPQGFLLPPNPILKTSIFKQSNFKIVRLQLIFKQAHFLPLKLYCLMVSEKLEYYLCDLITTVLMIHLKKKISEVVSTLQREPLNDSNEKVL